MRAFGYVWPIFHCFVHCYNLPRDYETRDYFAIEIAKDSNVDVSLSAIGLRLEHAIGQLSNHYLVSRIKHQEPELKKRSSGLLFLEKQVPRQRSKRRHYEPRNFATTHRRRQNSEISLAGNLTLIQEELSIIDPIFPDQWHLVNTREMGHDINVTGVWRQGITGKGTVVALVDDGIDMNSMDLAANYYAEGSYDFNDHNPIPVPKLSDDNHGTRCAGEIAAVRNDVCGIGIAYEGRVSGLRILSGRITDADEAASLNYDYDNNLIYSCSWGPPDDGRSMEAPSVLIQRAIVNGIKNGRGGKGSIFVFASGNGAVYDDNCNFDGYTNSIFSITIGGIDRLDSHPYYSELCAPQLAVTYSSGAGDYIHTTDVGERTCSDRHGGTSAAAPIGAGIFALVLSIRPDLTWRDMQYLCVETAVPFNPEDEDWQDTPAGFRFNHKFGYGKLDAFAIVERAKTWKNVKMQAWYISPVLSVAEELGTEPHQQITSYFEITQEAIKAHNLARIEHITVTVNIDHQRRGDVTIDLISPQGIISNLATVRRYDSSAEGFQDWTFMTVKHWGESGVGQWRLVAGDHDHPEAIGVFKSWRITLWGESLDEARAKPLPIPGEDETNSASVTSTYVPEKSVSTVSPVKSSTSQVVSINHEQHPTRPVISTHLNTPTTIAQPLPVAEDVSSMPHNTWNSKKGLWIYIASALILLFISGIGLWLCIHRRSEVTKRDSYEFKQLHRNHESEPAGELYDAFAAGVESSDDSDDASQDSLDELEPLRK